MKELKAKLKREKGKNRWQGWLTVIQVQIKEESSYEMKGTEKKRRERETEEIWVPPKIPDSRTIKWNGPGENGNLKTIIIFDLCNPV